MENTLKFSVNDIQLMDDIEKNLFRKVKIKAFATGENCHTMPIEEDVLKRGAKTIYNKPILWKYDRYFDDAMGHEKDEVPCGFVPETNDNPIKFERYNDRLYIVIYALLWTKYCGKLIKIFERDDKKKDVSVEIAVIEDEENKFNSKPKIKDFVISGITILGEMINPACKGCDAELLEFSENKSKFLRDEPVIKFESEITIDNSKESSVDGKSENPRRKLLVPLSNQPNRKALLKEAYLITDFKDEELQITKFKYPHHVIRNGKLVIHKTGLISAFKRVVQQNAMNDDIKKHILRHYKELGLSQENFSEFDLNEEEFNLYFGKDFRYEKVGDLDMEDKKKMKENEDKTEELKEERKQTEEDKEKVEDIKEGCKKMAENDQEKDVDTKETEEEEKDEEKEEEKEKEKEKEEDMAKEDKDAKIKEMSEKIDRLEEENKAYMSKIESMSDYEDLKKFKADTEERQMREEEMRKMTAVMEEIENKGICMSEDDKNALMSKIKEFSSLDAWSNYVKAQAFDMRENTDGVVKFSLPYTERDNAGSIWNKF